MFVVCGQGTFNGHAGDVFISDIYQDIGCSNLDQLGLNGSLAT